MLPEFPNFKTLELSDREDIEAITQKYPPYSDFNFTSMWSWDVMGEMRISQLHGNLIVRFNDYITGDRFYSFLGNSNQLDTVNKLLAFSNIEGLKPILRLLPEVSIQGLNINTHIEEDRDNFDYIYILEDLIHYKGSTLKTQRNLLSAFLRRNKEVKILFLDLQTDDQKQAILKLNDLWKNNKKIDIPYERAALERFLSISNPSKYITIGIFIQNKLIAFSISEKDIGTEYASCFFANADTEYYGIYSFLMNNTAKALKEFNFQYLNYEQDLGISCLRKAKESFEHDHFLKKYRLIG